jgi:hypothetical protein
MENGMRSTTTGLALLLAALVLPLAAGSAKAQAGLLDFGKAILGIEDEKPEIDYRPRPPLVVPPKKDLPQPADPATAKAQSWPNDPDVAALKKAEENRKKPVVMQNPARPLTIEEIRAGRVAGAGVPTEPVATGARNNSAWVPPSELRALEDKLKLSKAPETQPGFEPERQYLTDPPKGYRKAAAGAPVALPKQAPVVEEDTGPLSFFRKRKRDDDD